ncbi:MAG: Mu transposase C-terminal domain-containing protein [Rhizobiaceae bacterium]|nr:Mu transposase C-terminal domain-containing protein [Rhizobiaceae bacterium]
MTPPDARYQIGRLDRITIDDVHYEYVETNAHGHVLRQQGSELHKHVSHHEYEALRVAGSLLREPHYFARLNAQLQQAEKIAPLADLSRQRQERFLHKLDCVQRFREGYRLGRFRRSAEGYSAAAGAIAADQVRDAREALERHAEALDALEVEAETARQLLRLAGRRKGNKRYDSADEPEVNARATTKRRKVSGRALAGWVNRFEKHGCDANCLRDAYGNCGRAPKLDPEVDRVIKKSLEAYLTEHQASIKFCFNAFLADLHTINNERLERGLNGLRAPSYKTYRSRVRQIPAYVRVRAREGYDAAAAKFSMSSGGVVARYPMQRLEIDEWLVHVHLIDGEVVPQESLRSIGSREYELVRIHVAAVIDCATRYVLGVSFSRTASPANVHSALRMALSDRSAIASAVGAQTPWGPPGGLMEIYSDTGPSFDASFRSAVVGLGGTLGFGPAKKSDLRPKIERWFRTADLALLPYYTGRTFSNTVKLGGYPAEQRASATVDQFCWQAVRYIIDIYHNTEHEGLRGQTPHQAWLQAVRDHELPPAPDLHRLRVNLGLRMERKMSGEGVYFCNIPYNSERLQEHRRKHADGMVKIAVDPNDINHISVQLEDDWHILKSPQSLRLQQVPLHVWRSTLRDLRRRFQSEAAVAQETVIRALEAIRSSNEAAVIAAGLGALQPTAEELSRDEGRLRIGWTEPQVTPSSRSLAEGVVEDAGEFIAFTGSVGAGEADGKAENSAPGEMRSNDVGKGEPTLPTSPSQTSQSGSPKGWFSDGEDDWSSGD